MKRFLLFGAVFLLSLSASWAQERTVSGIVTSADDGTALPGVNVVVKGSTIGTVTSTDGRYTLQVSPGATLVFSFIGLVSQEIEVGQRSTIDVRMAQDVTQLTEVVVTGAGGIEARRREMGYSATTIRTSMLTQAKPINVASGLTGKVAGLQINTTSSGVNPNVRVVLRGNRSLTGNNEALIVVDNVVVPNAILSNLNPEDIEDITILNGSNAAALYGSEASNGALIVTTKKGRAGGTQVRIGHTTNLEKVSFFPEMQNRFGAGYAGGYPHQYVPYENQQYGPAFDGSIRPIGKPLESGEIQEIPYSPRDDKKKFWDTGVTNQTDISISGGDDKSTNFLSLQYLTNSGTTPKDEYRRASIRFNGTKQLSDRLSIGYSSNYVQNRYDITTATATIYDNLLQTPANIPLTQYKDWQNDPFANPNGYYNEYYDNPYWTIDNNRQDNKNDYLIANLELKWKPVEIFEITARGGVSSRANTYKNKFGKFTFTPYTKEISAAKTDVAGGVTDGSFNTTQVNFDLFGQVRKEIGSDFYFDGLLGTSLRNNLSKSMSMAGNGLVIPDLYNISNRVGEPVVSEGNWQARQAGLYGRVKLGYRDYLWLELTGRNDWVSVLAPENRSFFYPAASLSFIASEALGFLSNANFLDILKFRGGWSEVGQVNLGNRTTFGAYELQSTFSPSAGFPYGSLSGYSVDNRLVSNSLRPEMTTGWEAGFEISMFENRLAADFTYYSTNTTDQTVTTGVATSTGFTQLLQNTGEVSNDGIEAKLSVTPVRLSNGLEVVFGANYTYQENIVDYISGDLPRLGLSVGGQAQVYAVAGETFPVLIGTTYLRDPQGRIIVDERTGYPSASTEQKILGNTVPKTRLGLTTEIGFKGVRLSMLWEYRGDYVILYEGGSMFDFSGSSITTAYYNRERFVIPNSSYEDPENPGTYIENTNVSVTDGGAGFWTDGSFRRNVADNYLVSGDYWKLRELAITYSLPTSLLGENSFIKGVNLSVQGRNLIILTPKSNIYTDPDYNFSDQNAIGIVTLGATPPTRFYGASVSLTF